MGRNGGTDEISGSTTRPNADVSKVRLVNNLMAITYDVIVIGAGVVGCAVARRFTLEGASVLVLEKSTDILDGASKGNSALLHTGFDEPTDFLELQCIKDGYHEFTEIHEKLGLPVLKTGGLVIAWTADEDKRLQGLIDHAYANGVTDVERLTAKQITTREPHLSESIVGGFLIPQEYVIDPWSTPYAYLLQAIENGAAVLRETEVTGGQFDGSIWRLNTSRGVAKGKTIINCAGLYGDRMDTLLLGECEFSIRPRKGQFLVYDKPASRLVSSIILPVPSEITKGVVITPTIFGNVLVGPTAEEQDSREDTSVDSETLHSLREKGERMVPGLRDVTVTATYAGIRPATEFKDYSITFHSDRNYVSVGGIRSTGLSAALGIASYVFGQGRFEKNNYKTVKNIIWPNISSLAQDDERDWARPGNGGVVCHCELVTRREIERALTGPLAAASLSGLKRRTRVTMGRCQGFYCAAQLGEITAGRFVEPVAVGTSRGT